MHAGSEFIVGWDCVDMVVEVMSGDRMPVSLYVLCTEASWALICYRDQFYRR